MFKSVGYFIITAITVMLAYSQVRGQTYKDIKSEAVIKKMVTAHGGFAKWENSPSVSFSLAMYLSSLPLTEDRTYFDNWRYYQVQINPRSGHGFAYFPWTGAKVGYDGDTIWNKGYEHGTNFTNPPLFILYYHYSLINLPWLTQKKGTVMEYAGFGTIASENKEYHIIRMTFEPEGRKHDGQYLLYIDPDTYLLLATKHDAILPLVSENLFDKEFKAYSFEVIRIFEKHINQGGLIYPRGYTSLSGDGQNLAGTHIVLDVSFDKTLSPDDYIKPEGATIE